MRVELVLFIFLQSFSIPKPCLLPPPSFGQQNPQMTLKNPNAWHGLNELLFMNWKAKVNVFFLIFRMSYKHFSNGSKFRIPVILILNIKIMLQFTPKLLLCSFKTISYAVEEIFNLFFNDCSQVLIVIGVQIRRSWPLVIPNEVDLVCIE